MKAQVDFESTYQDPKSVHICGFFGSADSIRIQSLGVKIRVVEDEHIFSYQWVEHKAPQDTVLDSLDKMEREMNGTETIANEQKSINTSKNRKGEEKENGKVKKSKAAAEEELEKKKK